MVYILQVDEHGRGILRRFALQYTKPVIISVSLKNNYCDLKMCPFGTPQENMEKAITCFNDLSEFVEKLDPIKLITRLTLTYLLYPGREFRPEHDDG